MLSSIVEEDLRENIERVLSFIVAVLDDLDVNNRVHHLVPIAALYGVQYAGWRTRAERDASPNMMTANLSGATDAVVYLGPEVVARRSLSTDRAAIASDLTVLLRQRVRSRY